MHTTVEFAHKQPTVSVTETDGDTWYTICLNETIITKQFDYDGSNYDIVSYQYDFNNFKDNTIDKKDVLANPEKYIDYEPIPPVPPEKDPTVMERIETLEENQQTVIDALAEIIGGE